MIGSPVYVHVHAHRVYVCLGMFSEYFYVHTFVVCVVMVSMFMCVL